MRSFSEALFPMFAIVAMAWLLFPWGIGSIPRWHGLFGELIIGVIVDTTVLTLGIFIIVTACIGRP
jgi:hypothetical protein